MRLVLFAQYLIFKEVERLEFADNRNLSKKLLCDAINERPRVCDWHMLVHFTLTPDICWAVLVDHLYFAGLVSVLALNKSENFLCQDKDCYNTKIT